MGQDFSSPTSFDPEMLKLNRQQDIAGGASAMANRPGLDQMALARGMDPGQAGPNSGGSPSGKNQMSPPGPQGNGDMGITPGSNPSPSWGSRPQMPARGAMPAQAPMPAMPAPGAQPDMKMKIAQMLSRFGQALNRR